MDVPAPVPLLWGPLPAPMSWRRQRVERRSRYPLAASLPGCLLVKRRVWPLRAFPPKRLSLETPGETMKTYAQELRKLFGVVWSGEGLHVT